MPVTCASPSTACHHRLHVTVGHMVPPSSACHLHIAIACVSLFALPLAAWCPQAMPVTRASPSTAHHHRLHVTVGRMVCLSNARHPHIAIACASLFVLPLAAQCPQAMPVTHMSLLPARHHSHRRWPYCYDPGPYHQFSAIFYHFIPCSRSLVPHSFPHAPLGPLPNHLKSHLIDHLTIPQSTITCHHSTVRSILPHHHLTLSELPAHDVLFLDCQLMMEPYLELPHHDTPY